jgi:anti-anti-sigma factor
VLELAGEYDISTRDDLNAALDRAFADAHGLLAIDLTNVTFMDAHCTGMLISAAAHRRVVAVGATGMVARVMDVLDPGQHLPRRSTRPDHRATRLG